MPGWKSSAISVAEASTPSTVTTSRTRGDRDSLRTPMTTSGHTM